ncbi:hypothetical protein JOC77_002747 [Peribacillus deserti]|uniref:Aminodeoxychorismate lyase n=1 Tax=Peribacillus deserti TaxID=673318 RepID=A0ABS2QJH5_9BACI|nr:endolytic transglycosylase MltG [Peribacillus deserti]MBM7693307.1 hypothetical protein [Peribacillus deserti]
MSRSILQAFAAGLFVSAAILASYHFLFKKDKSISFSEAEHVIKEAGYSISKEPMKDQKKEKSKTSAAVTSAKPPLASTKEEKPKIKTYTLQVQSGMTPQDLSDILQKNGIIKDSDEFENYLKAHDLNENIQLGSFVLTSNMSIAQISSTITRN